jgi:hypothetical protein
VSGISASVVWTSSCLPCQQPVSIMSIYLRHRTMLSEVIVFIIYLLRVVAQHSSAVINVPPGGQLNITGCHDGVSTRERSVSKHSRSQNLWSVIETRNATCCCTLSRLGRYQICRQDCRRKATPIRRVSLLSGSKDIAMPWRNFVDVHPSPCSPGVSPPASCRSTNRRHESKEATRRLAFHSAAICRVAFSRPT